MNQNKGIIIFDGDCNLCNSAVRFIIKKDKKGRFLFTANKSTIAQNLLAPFNLSQDSIDSVILIQNDKVYTKSTAVLKIAQRLDGPIRLNYLFVLFPRFIRDFFYRLISKNRYVLFGKNTKCDVQDLHLSSKERFLI